MSRTRRFELCAALLFALTTLGFTGCSENLSAEAKQAREKFLLTSRPTGEQTVKSIREALAEGMSELEIVLIGRIDGGQMPAFEDGRAAFLFADGIGHGGTDHDPFACKFCSKNPENYAASVRFEVEGNVVSADARKLFQVTERQKVMITGNASIDDSDDTNLLEVEATGIYIVPEE